MLDLNIYIEKNGHTTRQTAIGFYIINGFFSEGKDIQGISYCLDQSLHESLCAQITDCGDGDVRTITNYGYSSFLVTCDSEKVMANLSKMADILLHNCLSLAVCDGQRFISAVSKKKRKALDSVYYSLRSPNSPLSRQLRPPCDTAFRYELLNAWKTEHYRAERCCVILTGNVPNEVAENIGNCLQDISLPREPVQNITLPRHMPWKYSQLILSSAFELNQATILCAEAACKWIEPRIAWALNAVGCRLGHIRIYPDYIQEWRVQMQCSVGMEQIAFKIVMDTLREIPESDEALTSVRERTQNGYLQMVKDAVEWNLFAGYNAISGQRYCLKDLLSKEAYCQQITKSSVCAMLQAWQESEHLSIFATSAY